MNRLVDPRLLKSKEKLFTAYLQLLKTTSREKITITALTEMAGINRVTFYKQYQHNGQFHEAFLMNHIEKLYRFMEPLNYKTYEKGFEVEALVELFQHIKEERTVYKVLFTSANMQDFYPSLLAYFQQKMKKHTSEMAKFDFPGTGVNHEIVAWYGMSALFGTIQLWAQSDFSYTPEYLAKSFSRLAPSPK